MERIVKFRGVAMHGAMAEKWVFGSLCIGCDGNTLIDVRGYNEMGSGFHALYEVYPESVGQFTGLTNGGFEIFEGDVIECLESCQTRRIGRYIVNYNTTYGVNLKPLTYIQSRITLDQILKRCIVVGNTFRNPEYMKGGEL